MHAHPKDQIVSTQIDESAVLGSRFCALHEAKSVEAVGGFVVAAQVLN
jgi:hypothetical protein